MLYIRLLSASLLSSVLLFHTPQQASKEVAATTQTAPPSPNPAMPPAQEAEKNPGIATKNPLYVAQNLEGGSKLQLSDGSLYEINPDDRDLSSSWLLPSNVKVEASNDPNYPYRIINLLTGTSIKAKKIDPSSLDLPAPGTTPSPGTNPGAQKDTPKPSKNSSPSASSPGKPKAPPPTPTNP